MAQRSDPIELTNMHHGPYQEKKNIKKKLNSKPNIVRARGA